MYPLFLQDHDPLMDVRDFIGALFNARMTRQMLSTTNNSRIFPAGHSPYICEVIHVYECITYKV